jgi:hypothetical protein
MGNYAYKHEEDAIIKEWYPKEGLPGAVLRLQLAGYKRLGKAEGTPAEAQVTLLHEEHRTDPTADHKQMEPQVGRALR